MPACPGVARTGIDYCQLPIYTGNMITHMDRFGRVLVPKRIRDAQGLKLGMDIEAVETPSGVLLRPPRREATLKREKGLLVHTGELLVDVDIVEFIKRMREERSRKFMGLE